MDIFELIFFDFGIKNIIGRSMFGERHSGSQFAGNFYCFVIFSLSLVLAVTNKKVNAIAVPAKP